MSHRRIGLAVLLALSVVPATSAARTALPACSTKVTYTRAERDTASKTVRRLFPSAATLGFLYRNDHGWQPRRDSGPGWCGSWWVDYSDRPPSGSHGYVRGYVDVSVTIYGSPAQASAALQEALGSSQALANGATVRVAPDGGAIESAIRNVVISTVSSYPYVNGQPDNSRAPNFGLSVQMRIHRRIQAAVMRSR
jgi:hypothetical protein